MKKTYIKPQATVVAMDTKECLLNSGSTQLYGKEGTIMNASFSDIDNSEGLSKRNGGGLWDDDEE